MSRASASAIGGRIRELRARVGLDQAELGAVVGATRWYVSLIESGKQAPDRELLLAFATYFEVSVDWLLTGQGEVASALTLTASERQLVLAFRKLPIEKAAALLASLEAKLKDSEQ